MTYLHRNCYRNVPLRANHTARTTQGESSNIWCRYRAHWYVRQRNTRSRTALRFLWFVRSVGLIIVAYDDDIRTMQTKVRRKRFSHGLESASSLNQGGRPCQAVLMSWKDPRVLHPATIAVNCNRLSDCPKNEGDKPTVIAGLMA